ncbi:MAG TPA: PilZ domain-containing protein [Spongiibacteraceae bacterium]|nr:PilZ domain-containing protein [Spongiibacteraceae bacterium]HUH36304.1 PilZ domain-containing protein [Spongiibacteraceae bacterium]
MSNTDDHRRRERAEPAGNIAVLDSINGGVLGELINISVDGLMLMTAREIATQSILQLSLQLPAPLLGSGTIELGADCLWCRKAEDQQHYWAGFQIIDASDEAVRQIETLIQQHAR